MPDGTPEPAAKQDPELHYEPTTWPGAHLPHVWLERNGQLMSTLDLVADNGFTLFTGIGGDHWTHAAEAAATACDTCIKVHHVGIRDGILYAYGDWAALLGVEDTGAVLVRPDRHVAWRAARLPMRATAELTDVIARLLGLGTVARSTDIERGGLDPATVTA